MMCIIQKWTTACSPPFNVPVVVAISLQLEYSMSPGKSLHGRHHALADSLMSIVSGNRLKELLTHPTTMLTDC